MSFFVNRKCTGPNDVNVVTVSTSLENIEVLFVQYNHLGEGEAFDRPQDAAHAAIDVAAAWQRDHPDTQLHLAFEPTEDCIPEFLPYAIDEVGAEAQLLLRTRSHWGNASRCDECRCKLASNVVFATLDGDECKFCSPECANAFEVAYYADDDDGWDDDDGDD